MSLFDQYYRDLGPKVREMTESEKIRHRQRDIHVRELRSQEGLDKEIRRREQDIARIKGGK